MVNLLETLQNSFGSSLSREASRYLGEPETATKTAVSALIPTMLAGLMRQSTAPTGAGRLLDLLKTPGLDVNLPGQLNAALSGGEKTDELIRMGGAIASTLFGDKSQTLAGALGSMSGLKPQSATSLMALAGPLVLGGLKNIVGSQRLDVGGLVQLLLGQKDHLSGALDSRLTNALGWGSPSAFLSSLGAPAMAAASGAAASARGGLSRALPWLGLLIVGIIAFNAIRSCGPNARSNMEQAALATGDAAQSAVDATKRALKQVALPGGLSIEVVQGGFIESLVNFLNDPAADLKRGIAFDDVNFETGSARLTAGSSQQLEQLATVLKAYGQASVRVEGHTDNVGDPQTNLQLSKDRASEVKAALERLGIAPGRVEAFGFGQERPSSPNDTEQGRALNRRVELYVTKR